MFLFAVVCVVGVSLMFPSAGSINKRCGKPDGPNALVLPCLLHWGQTVTAVTSHSCLTKVLEQQQNAY